MLKHGADPNFKDAMDNTPYHIATKLDKLDWVKVLEVHGGDALIKNSSDETPLKIIMNKKNQEAIRYILQFKKYSDAAFKK